MADDLLDFRNRLAMEYDRVSALNDRRLDEIDAGARFRSEVRFRFMLLAAGVAGVVGPILAERPRIAAALPLSWASGVLLFTVIIGVVDELADRLLTRRARNNFQDYGDRLLAFSLTAVTFAAEEGRVEGTVQKHDGNRTKMESALSAYRASRDMSLLVRNVGMAVFYFLFTLGVGLLIAALAKAA